MALRRRIAARLMSKKHGSVVSWRWMSHTSDPSVSRESVDEGRAARPSSSASSSATVGSTRKSSLTRKSAHYSPFFEERLISGASSTPTRGAATTDLWIFRYRKHHRINHGENIFARDRGIHINGIESFWGTAKTRLAKRRGIRKDLFYLHLKECEFRFNYRRTNLYQTLMKLIKGLPL